MSNAYPSTELHRLLSNPRYEVLPTPSIEEQIRAHIPTGLTVTVTASPAKPIDTTIELATTLAAAGYDAVPHLAARMIGGRGQLSEIVERLTAAGVSKVFVPAGDAKEPAGEYVQSLDLLRDLDFLGRPFEQVAITGYPESHPSIDDDVTIQSMWDKRTYATHIISNMTFDDARLATWVERIRRRGIALPLYVGVPGPVERTKLLGMATKIGVGESMRFLKKQKSIFARIAAPGFGTDSFVHRVAALAANDALGIAGLHLFTFNQVEATENWRQRLLRA
ncbi:conserved hypothetical protein [Nostocoides japonicum T1-X7]|uniref:Methylenetetrahydrofolate reductase n=1 Tax=Nostocoides japonicum T1-X7 TaxID=1194083 RepID=A0A077M5P2_9MICO|nr:methylenetetrahydrofolate reductase [Tetrasphaera japonica]CCH79489.1 conserved hypothetical protein [Tetrasphaera japonica T1-X7]